jgi:hypothetical protein
MFNTKCGCPDCLRQSVPHTRVGWKSRKNKSDNYYGSHKNPTAKHGGHKQGH